MSTLYKRGATWWVAYFVNGQRVQRSLKTASRTQAREVVKAIEGDLVRQTHGLPMRHVAVEEMVQAFLDDRRPVVSPTYLGVLRVRLRDFVTDTGARRPEDITPASIDAWLKRRRDALGPTRAHRDYGILRTWLRWATREKGYFAVNPLERVKAPKEPARPPIRFLSREEAERLLASCSEPIMGGQGGRRARRTPLRTLVAVAIYAGPRLSEILHLHWEHVDLERDILHFVKTKTGAGRMVPINDSLRAELAAYRDALDVHEGLVFQTASGRPYSKHNMMRELRKAVRRAELKDVTWNTLRHTAASWMVQGDVTLFKVSKILGHASTRMTEKHYASLMVDDLRDAIAKTGRI